MSILERIANYYDFANLKWLDENTRFASDRGNKRILWWTDKDLLNWHITWRDELGRWSGHLVDRMIRTNGNKPYIKWDGRYITVHDDELEGYRPHLDAKVVGSFLGEMLTTAKHLEAISAPLCQKVSFPERSLLPQPTECELDESTSKLVTRALHEARKRLKLADTLKEKANNEEPPITDLIKSINQCQLIMHSFSWRGGTDYPHNAYSSLRSFLQEWHNNYGDQSVRDLLSAIDEKFPIGNEQGFLLLAEVLAPWEMIDFLESIRSLKENGEQQLAVEVFQTSWEEHRQLVTTVADWIDTTRKKVVQ